MATWTTTAQLTAGTLGVGATDRIWLNGTGGAYGTNVTVGSYQDGSHISDSSDVHLCTTNHVHNTKFLTSGTVSIDGAGSSALPVATGSCGLKFNFSDASSIATSAASFYAYDGTTDATGMVGITFQAAEGGVSSAWVAANGSGSALGLANQSAATSHDFFVAVSATPTSTGAKTGKVKITLTYV